jgi:hypothetical protein
MADNIKLHIEGGSAEQIAYKLMQDIAYSEGVRLYGNTTGRTATREWILSTYVEAITAVKQPHRITKAA